MEKIPQSVPIAHRKFLVAFALPEGGHTVWIPRFRRWQWHSELPPTIKVGAVTYTTLCLGIASPEIREDVARAWPRGPAHVTAEVVQ